MVVYKGQLKAAMTVSKRIGWTWTPMIDSHDQRRKAVTVEIEPGQEIVMLMAQAGQSGQAFSSYIRKRKYEGTSGNTTVVAHHANMLMYVVLSEAKDRSLPKSQLPKYGRLLPSRRPA
jgi:hypothetical protein